MNINSPLKKEIQCGGKKRKTKKKKHSLTMNEGNENMTRVCALLNSCQFQSPRVFVPVADLYQHANQPLAAPCSG